MRNTCDNYSLRRWRSVVLACLVATFAASQLAVTTSARAGDIFEVFGEPDYVEINYTLTVTLEVDGEQLTASTVQGLAALSSPRSATVPAGIHVTDRGEALVFDLPGRPALFFLQSTRNARHFAPQVAAACNLYDKPSPEIDVLSLDRFRNFTGPCSLDLDRRGYRPLVVHFGDEADRTTMRQVDLFDPTGTWPRTSHSSALLLNAPMNH